MTPLDESPSASRRDSSKALKVVLIALGVCVLLAACAALAGFLWLENNAKRIKAEGEKLKTAAAEFGRGRPPADCLDEALKRLDGAAGIMNEVRSGIFLQYCIEASRKSLGFCADVPDDGEIMATVAWRLKTCTDLGRENDQPCHRLMGAVQKSCRPADTAEQAAP